MKIKRLVKSALGIVLAASMLVGCGATGGAAGGATGGTTPTVTDDSQIKIGVSIWSSTDVLGSQCKLILDEGEGYCIC